MKKNKIEQTKEEQSAAKQLEGVRQFVIVGPNGFREITREEAIKLVVARGLEVK